MKEIRYFDHNRHAMVAFTIEGGHILFVDEHIMFTKRGETELTQILTTDLISIR